MKATILGCGSSGGVPRIGGFWGACDPNESRNRRLRCSLLVERGGTSVLVDTSPDLREQLLRTGVQWLDGVLYTHDHADQTHGIDDLRALLINRRRRVDVYMDAVTEATLLARFGYCFATPDGSQYPPILHGHQIKPFVPVNIEGEGGAITALPFVQDHGDVRSLGFRFGTLGYSSDLVGLSEESFRALDGIEIWIVDALRYRPHPSHAHLKLALEWIDRLKPRQAILTNMHIDMDYQTLRRELPEGVEPAYDGMTIEFEG
jgi:phosphoribosyl 1,2-cyclic phosphate phosphodiesterase